MTPCSPSRSHSWLQLIRVPNLLTVPGDPLVGILLGAWSVGTLSPYWFMGVLASVLLYAGGLILNDLMDFDEDLRDRPERPLPSGAISRLAAWRAYAGLSVLALLPLLAVGKASFFGGLLLFLFIALYNVGTKKIPVLGPITMGVCRGCSALLGATMLNDPFRLTYGDAAYFQILVLYVGLVTMLAHYETRKKSPRWLGSFVVLVLLVGLVALPLCVKNHTVWQDGFFSLLVVGIAFVGFGIARKIFVSRRTEPGDIGKLVCLLVLVQASAMLLSPFPVVGLLWIFLWPFTLFVGKRFYVS